MPAPELPERIGCHRVLGELGRGGMARVFHVRDENTGRECALKQLRAEREEVQKRNAAMFEREFQILVQLAHPHLIQVYDYGVSADGPYYTMELLDGGDLRDLAPLPWKQVCRLAYDVCSSLALLHSRRLVHRDVSPRNIRCTRTGEAKLIDFGAMVAMGPGGQIVGTPAFVAPEVVYRSSLDGRCDLYSLGTTMYYALTGRPPFAARDFASVRKAWNVRPETPSKLTPDVPPELDALVLSLLSAEPALRPKSAFEVMQRLSPLIGETREESHDVAQAYLVTPLLVGRDGAIAAFQSRMRRAVSGRGRGVLVEAADGLGRSRMLDAFVLEAKLLGALTVRGDAGAERTSGSVARALAEQLIDAVPELARTAADELSATAKLFAPSTPGDAALVLAEAATTPAAQLEQQTALAQWILRISDDQPLLIAVDDVDRIDPTSVGLLAALAARAQRRRLLVCAAAAPVQNATAEPLEVLASHCVKLTLRPLDRAQTEALLASVFGDVPNLALLAERIHSVAAGRPRECMALAQHLVDRGVITYAGGSWTLPEVLAASDLPGRAEEVFQARVAALGPQARRFAQLHALSTFDAFQREDYPLLEPEAAQGAIDAALSELLAHEVLASDGQSYRIAHAAMRAALLAEIDGPARTALHAALGELCERTGRTPVLAAAHWFEAGETHRALDRLIGQLAPIADRTELERITQISPAGLARLIERAVDAVEGGLSRPRRDVYELWRWMVLLSINTEDRLHARAAPVLLPQLERDAGLSFFRELPADTDPMQRVLEALRRAGEAYQATPEAERVYRVDEAIKNLAYYVAISIAVGSRTYDPQLVASLPALLEPFAPLSPVLHAMWQNTLATVEMNRRQFLRARARWLEVYGQLETQTDPIAEPIRNAIAYGLGTIEAQLGFASCERWAAVLDGDAMQRVNGLYLRRVICLQRGDFSGAEAYRRKAEVLELQAAARQMFSTTVALELAAHAHARDLTGVKHALDRIARLATQHAGWKPFLHLAEAQLHRLRGELAQARAACELALSLSEPDPMRPDRSIMAWPSVLLPYLEVLVELGHAEEARDFGRRALARCEELEIVWFEVARSLALAEARCGDLACAAQRVERVIAEQQALGVTGVNLGASYEARARIAIWAGDHATAAEYCDLTALEYRYGRDSALGTRYDRLLHEARGAGLVVDKAVVRPAESLRPDATTFGEVTRTTVAATVGEIMSAADGPAARAERALNLLCDAYGTSGGHLYVMGPDGLRLAASIGPATPDAQVERTVVRVWHERLNEADQATVIDDGATSGGYGERTWTDLQGTEHVAVPLSGAIDGALQYAGIAALIVSPGTKSVPNAEQVSTAVAACLLRSGDARGVAA